MKTDTVIARHASLNVKKNNLNSARVRVSSYLGNLKKIVPAVLQF